MSIALWRGINIVLCLLCALNRARMISRILNAISHVFQSDAVWAPC